jgi:GNAT superfamily N-acetyltransferase
MSVPPGLEQPAEGGPPSQTIGKPIPCLFEDRIARVAVGDDGVVLGWIGGIAQYDGNVWELHPLVVDPWHQRQGIGRALVTDLEDQVRQRGGLTLWLGTDDEDGVTTLAGVDLYADVLGHLARIRNVREDAPTSPRTPHAAPAQVVAIETPGSAQATTGAAGRLHSEIKVAGRRPGGPPYGSENSLHAEVSPDSNPSEKMDSVMTCRPTVTRNLCDCPTVLPMVVAVRVSPSTARPTVSGWALLPRATKLDTDLKNT